MGGYKLKTYYFVQILHELFDLTIIVITDDSQTEEDREFLKTNSVSYKIYTLPKWKCYLNSVQSIIFGKRPIQVEYYFSQKIKTEIRPLLENSDFIIPSLTRTFEYVPSTNLKSKIIFDEVDSYALSYERSKEKTNSFFWKMMYKVESGRLENYEKNAVQKSDATLLVNQEETKYWNQFGKCFWLPNGITPQLFSYKKVKNPRHAIAFFGKMNYRPNIDAVKWYCQHVLPKLPGDLLFYIIGIYPTKEIYELAKQHQNVRVTGFMDDPYQLISECLALISPMQTGGGIQNKVLDGMALGIVNIVSTLAAKPIGGLDGQDFLVADTVDQHVAHVGKVQEDTEFRDYIGSQARKYVLEKFTWENYKANFEQIIHEIS